MSSSFTPVQFVKMVPGGNPTILVHGTLPGAAAWPRLAARLLHPMHLQAEQAGAVQLPSGGGLAHLHMMGGEFCVNATRAAAFWLARQGLFAPCGPEAVMGRMTVSGAIAPVTVVVAGNEACLASTIQQLEAGELPCPKGEGFAAVPHAHAAPKASVHTALPTSMPNALVACPEFGVQGAAAARLALHEADWRLEHLEEGATVVHLPGISHVLLDAAIHAVPQVPTQHTARWRNRAGLEHCAASGIIWYMPQDNGYAIVPVVYVRDTATEHAETACGSGSLALALLLQSVGAVQEGAATALTQPSGEALTVQLFSVAQAAAGNAPESDEPGVASSFCHAYVAGAVQLVAEGMAYCT